MNPGLATFWLQLHEGLEKRPEEEPPNEASNTQKSGTINGCYLSPYVLRKLVSYAASLTKYVTPVKCRTTNEKEVHRCSQNNLYTNWKNFYRRANFWNTQYVGYWIAFLLSIKKLIKKWDSLSPGPHQCLWFLLNVPQLIWVRARTAPEKLSSGLLFTEPCFHFASFPGIVVIHCLMLQKFCILKTSYKKWKVYLFFPLTAMYLFKCIGFYERRIICLVLNTHTYKVFQLGKH